MTYRMTLAERLTSARRHALPKRGFALGGERYPIPDKSHARNALSRVSANGTTSEKKRVHAAVCRKYPSIASCESVAVEVVANLIEGDQVIVGQGRRALG